MSKVDCIKRYKQKNLKQITVSFYPKDHDLYEAIRERGKEEGNITKFIIETLRKEIKKSKNFLLDNNSDIKS